MVLGINGALRAQLTRIRYLGPLRSFPPRHLAFSDDRGRNWLAGGGYAWDVVRTDAEVRNAVNRWLGSEALKTRYELQIRTLGSLDALEEPLAEAIEVRSQISCPKDHEKRPSHQQIESLLY